MNKQIEIREAVARFIGYVKLNWEVEQSFEIAFDSVYDIIGKETFLNKCQAACKEMSIAIVN